MSAGVGVAENANTAVLVTVGPGGHVLDRRTVQLTTGLPTHPYHHEGAWAVGRYLDTPGARRVPLSEAVALVERVREAALRGARESLEALAATVTTPIAGIALRACPELPPTIEACIRDNRAQTVADSVMYRRALATAAQQRGWTVHWYDRERLLARRGLDAKLQKLGRAIGPPWQAKHKLAAAAALSTLER